MFKMRAELIYNFTFQDPLHNIQGDRSCIISYLINARETTSWRADAWRRRKARMAFLRFFIVVRLPPGSWVIASFFRR